MTVTQQISEKRGFLHGTPALPNAILEAEDTLRLHFAEEYRDYLEDLGLATFEGHELTGISKTARLSVIEATEKERAQNPNVPCSFYVVEKTNIDGIVIWQAPTGEIYQTEFNGKPHLICKSLAEYIESI